MATVRQRWRGEPSKVLAPILRSNITAEGGGARGGFTVAHLIIRKGIHREIDSHSTFTDNDRRTDTGLAGYLRNANLKKIFICGLALDYCVYWSAVDGTTKGFETLVIPELCKGIAEETSQKAIQHMSQVGVKLIGVKDFE